MDHFESSSNEVSSNMLRTLNRMFVVFILTVIFYGAFRKWILPGFSNVIYVFPDFVLMYIYIYAVRFKLFPGKPIDFLFYTIFIGLFVLAIIQSVLYSNVITPLFGWRNYCFTLPLVVLMYTYMDRKTLDKIAVYLCLIAIPTAILVVIQSNSPVEAYINRSVGEGENQRIFVVAKDVVRVTGFFSFNTGHSLYTFATLSMFVYLLFKKVKILPYWLLILSGLSILVCVVVSGSRGNVIVTGTGIVVLVLSQLFSIRYKKSFYTLLLSFLLLMLGYFFVTKVFSNKIDNLEQRFETADSFSERMGGLFSGVADPIRYDLPLLGYGLGISSPGATMGLAEQLPFDFAYEHEWARFFVETGMFIGFILIVFRVALSVLMIIFSVKTFFFRERNPASLILTAVFFMNMFVGQMSMNALAMYFGWYFFAVQMALYRIERESNNSLV